MLAVLSLTLVVGAMLAYGIYLLSSEVRPGLWLAAVALGTGSMILLVLNLLGVR